MKNYFIIGHGSLHSIAREILPADAYAGYYDDKEGEVADWRGKFTDIAAKGNDFIIGFAAIRNMMVRSKIYASITNAGGSFVNAISKQACVYQSAQTGKGNIITPFCVIGANARIGNNCVLFSNTTIEHDCVLGDNINIAPGVSVGGKVTIGNNVFIGIGTSLRDGITIGNNVLIGAGSIVLHDIPDNMVVYGHPAKVVCANDRFL
jgi:sugar O-acyltransferase (sialic acid O-acetyltransferase NeuD family)